MFNAGLRVGFFISSGRVFDRCNAWALSWASDLLNYPAEAVTAGAVVFAVRHSNGGRCLPCADVHAGKRLPQAIRTTEICNSCAHHPLLGGQTGPGG